jgi:hypothetical protein
MEAVLIWSYPKDTRAPLIIPFAPNSGHLLSIICQNSFIKIWNQKAFSTPDFYNFMEPGNNNQHCYY